MIETWTCANQHCSCIMHLSQLYVILVGAAVPSVSAAAPHVGVTAAYVGTAATYVGAAATYIPIYIFVRKDLNLI